MLLIKALSSYKIYISSLKLSNFSKISVSSVTRCRRAIGKFMIRPNEINSIRFAARKIPGTINHPRLITYIVSYRIVSVRKLMRVIRHVILPPVTPVSRSACNARLSIHAFPIYLFPDITYYCPPRKNLRIYLESGIFVWHPSLAYLTERAIHRI